MRHFGIIGNPLEHSFSAKYFTDKFLREHIDADYRLLPMDDLHGIGEVLDAMAGLNVTLPYKQTIIPYLTDIDDTARAIGAVNVLRGRRGYNTDWIGFVESLRPLLCVEDKRALVLGTGGVSKAVQYGLRQLGIDFVSVSRTPHADVMTYEAVTADVLSEHTLIVNCTPLGMFPNVDSCPCLPYESIGSKHLLFDCVYNPEQTLFLRHGMQQGARVKNGLEMLHIQAEAAWRIWNENNQSEK